MRKDIVYVGDKAAKLHILDPKKNYEHVKTYDTAHNKGITGVHCTNGCLITGSLDKTVRVSSPTDPPQNLTTLNCGYGEIAGVSIFFHQDSFRTEIFILIYIQINIIS